MELHKTLTLTLNEEQGNRVVKKIRTLSKVLRGLRTGDKFTMALFSLVTAFFICNIVFMGELMMKAVRAVGGVKFAFKKQYEIVSRLMLVLNSCTNVFIYCFADRTFKKHFKDHLKHIWYLMTCKQIKFLETLENENIKYASAAELGSTKTTNDG